LVGNFERFFDFFTKKAPKLKNSTLGLLKNKLVNKKIKPQKNCG
jgi:hypothetical protein